MNAKQPLLIAGLLLVGNSAMAASVSDTFQVTATVATTCQNLASTDLDFGNYDPFNGSDTLSTSTISVTCTNQSPYTIALNAGNSGDFGNRTLSSGSDNINYNLYADAAFNNVWGDGSGGSSTVPGTGSGAPISTTVYGKIVAGQNVSAGSYTDTITVTVDY